MMIIMSFIFFSCPSCKSQVLFCALEAVGHNYVTTQVFQFLGKTSSHYTAIYRMGAAIITCLGNCIRATVILIQGVIQVPKVRK